MKKSTALSTTIVSLTRKLSLSLLMMGSLIIPTWGQSPTNRTVEIIPGSDLSVGDDITIRVKVTEGDEPVKGLDTDNFELQVEDIQIQPNNIHSNYPFVLNDTPPDAFIVVLLDMSGSMNCPQYDTGYVCEYVDEGRKFDAAIEALEKFIKQAEQRKGTTKIAIVPFGIGGNDGCLPSYIVTEDKINNFKDAKGGDALNYLKNNIPKSKNDVCASTNLYQSLVTTVDYLSDKGNSTFYPGNTSEAPILSIILLSDGYDNDGSDDQEQFEELEQKLEMQKKDSEKYGYRNQIIISTLGYGLTPEELAYKYRYYLGDEVKEVNAQVIAEIQKTNEKIAEYLALEYVDKETLAKIANATGQTPEFTKDPDEVADNLIKILNRIDVYELTFTAPDADKAKRYNVTVSLADGGETSNPEEVRVDGRVSLDPIVRAFLFIFTGVAFLLLWFIPFSQWGQKLKQQETEE